MSMVKICDVCGRRLFNSEGIYHLDYVANSSFYKDKSLDICEKCIKVIKKLSLEEENGGEK